MMVTFTCRSTWYLNSGHVSASCAVHTYSAHIIHILHTTYIFAAMRIDGDICVPFYLVFIPWIQVTCLPAVHTLYLFCTPRAYLQRCALQILSYIYWLNVSRARIVGIKNARAPALSLLPFVQGKVSLPARSYKGPATWEKKGIKHLLC